MKTIGRLSGDEARSIGSALFWAALDAAMHHHANDNTRTRIAVQSALRAALVMGDGQYSSRIADVVNGLMNACRFRLHADNEDTHQLRITLAQLQRVEWATIARDTTVIIFEHQDGASCSLVYLNKYGSALATSTPSTTPVEAFRELAEQLEIPFLNR